MGSPVGHSWSQSRSNIYEDKFLVSTKSVYTAADTFTAVGLAAMENKVACWFDCLGPTPVAMKLPSLQRRAAALRAARIPPAISWMRCTRAATVISSRRSSICSSMSRAGSSGLCKADLGFYTFSGNLDA